MPAPDSATAASRPAELVQRRLHRMMPMRRHRLVLSLMLKRRRRVLLTSRRRIVLSLMTQLMRRDRQVKSTLRSCYTAEPRCASVEDVEGAESTISFGGGVAIAQANELHAGKVALSMLSLLLNLPRLLWLHLRRHRKLIIPMHMLWCRKLISLPLKIAVPPSHVQEAE